VRANRKQPEGLIYNSFDDTYSLYGVNIDREVYDNELQATLQQAAYEQQVTRLSEAQQINAAYGLAALYGAAGIQNRYRSIHESSASTKSARSSDGSIRHESSAIQKPQEQPKTWRRESPGRRAIRQTLYGHCGWRFDSPFAPLKARLFKWAWTQARTHRRAA